jgi:hypothetical protein
VTKFVAVNAAEPARSASILFDTSVFAESEADPLKLEVARASSSITEVTAPEPERVDVT